jgi:hypothetical protein
MVNAVSETTFMSAFVVNLSETGMFEIPARSYEEASFRVGCNPDDPALPWFVLSTDELGVKWQRERAFGDLDSALDYAVARAFEGDRISEYDVRLPCGKSFRRPGRVPAEQVMASMDWLYVEEMLGWTAHATSINVGVMQARKEILKKAEDTQVELGSVDLVEEADGQRHWCADVHIPYQGFIHRDDIETQFKLCFASEGFIVLDTPDFRARVIRPASQAVIVDFMSFREAKMREAA